MGGGLSTKEVFKNPQEKKNSLPVTLKVETGILCTAASSATSCVFAVSEVPVILGIDTGLQRSDTDTIFVRWGREGFYRELTPGAGWRSGVLVENMREA